MPAVYYAKAEPSPAGKKLIKVYHWHTFIFLPRRCRCLLITKTESPLTEKVRCLLEGVIGFVLVEFLKSLRNVEAMEGEPILVFVKPQGIVGITTDSTMMRIGVIE